MLKLFNQLFFYRLINSNNKSNYSLFGYYNSSKIKNGIIIQLELDKYRLFTLFKDYIELFHFIENLDKETCCLHEVIHSNKHQKPYFDIDDLFDVDIDDIKENFITSIISICDEVNVKINIKKDILIFNSNGLIENDKMKYSYHIIVDNYYCINSVQNKIFCMKVIDKFNKLTNYQYDKFIDKGIYSSTHNLRIFGFPKFKTYRYKKFELCNTYKNKNYIHYFPENCYDKNNNLDGNIQYMNLLQSSLITSTNISHSIPTFHIEEKKVEEIINTTDEQINYYISLLRNEINVKLNIYQIRNNKVELISEPYFCTICCKIHENQNPFIKFYHNHVYWNCRRSSTYKILGEFKNIEKVKNLDTLQCSIIMNNKVVDIDENNKNNEIENNENENKVNNNNNNNNEIENNEINEIENKVNNNNNEINEIENKIKNNKCNSNSNSLIILKNKIKINIVKKDKNKNNLLSLDNNISKKKNNPLLPNVKYGDNPKKKKNNNSISNI